MLQVKNIEKTYVTGDLKQTALDKVSLDLRDNEFVAILGPSGSGKTTLLNIIGGLDRYDSGDLIINGTSTKEYTDRDWDAYRNHSIGFVFQSYNLIPHQTILSNVELALTISGTSKEQRTKLATEALQRVGLGDHIHKRPNQLSGGQMQRVAIARALVNNPDIILADEPTGALDSKTSVQIMDLLKEVAADKLVIMVTHNPELAEEYASRIITLKDGVITSDTDPYYPDGVEAAKAKPEHTKLGFLSALALSLNNLWSKKGRTFLTSFAGSVGIIGIALILALSNGVNTYIKATEGEMLGSYPIQIQQQNVNLDMIMDQGSETRDSAQNGESASDAPLAQASRSSGEDTAKKKDGFIRSVPQVSESLQQSATLIKKNNLKAFKAYIEKNQSKLNPSITSVEYKYDIEPQIYRDDPKNGLIKVYPSSLNISMTGDTSMTTDNAMGLMSSAMLSQGLSSNWEQLPASSKLQKDRYTVLSGKMPQKYDEVALVVQDDDTINDYMLYTLGILDIGEMNQTIADSQNGKDVKGTEHKFKYSDIIGKTFSCFSPAQLYTQSNGVYVDRSDDESYMRSHIGNGTQVKITAVLRYNDGGSTHAGIAYPQALTYHLMDEAADTAVVKAQIASPDTNVLTGKAFASDGNSTGIENYLSGLMTIGTASKADQKAEVSYDMHKPNAKTFLLPTAYAAEKKTPAAAKGDTPSYPFEALLNYTMSMMEDAMMNAFNNAFTREQVSNMVKRYVNSLSDEEKQKLVSEFTSGLSADDLKDIAAQYSGNMSEEDLQKLVQQYLGNMSQSDMEALAQQVIGNMSQEDMQKIAETYIAGMTQADIQALIKQYTGNMSEAQLQALIASYVGSIDSASLESMVKQYLMAHQDQLIAQLKNSLNSDDLKAMLAGLTGSGVANDYDSVMKALGYTTKDNPSSISIYPKDFDSKAGVTSFIADYNKQVKNDDEKIGYTDYIETLTSSIMDIINTFSKVLIAFVAISLVVSSIMIAIITYISVLERTKEIGILRALGSSKHDITSIFNSETIIEGFISGLLGVIIAWLLSFPINSFAAKNYGVDTVAALPINYAIYLILISVALTFIAGFIPARIAAKKDPVTALRSD